MSAWIILSEGNAVIILQPGSSILHLTVSTSYTPHSLPHLIAYRSTEGGGESGGAESARVIQTDGSLVLRHEVEINKIEQLNRAATFDVTGRKSST